MLYGYVGFLYSQDEIELALDHVSRAGYQGIEFNQETIESQAGWESLKDALSTYDLEVCCIMSAYLESERSLMKIESSAEAANELDAEIIATLPPRREKVGWSRFVNLLEKAQRITEDYGLTFVLHNHIDSLVEKESEIEKVLGEVPDLKLLFDTAHYYPYGDVGQDMKSFKGKIGYVHLKDTEQPKGNQPEDYYQAFTDLGKGVIDFKAVLRELEKFYDGWITVEIENQRMDRFGHANYNLNYLRSIKQELT